MSALLSGFLTRQRFNTCNTSPWLIGGYFTSPLTMASTFDGRLVMWPKGKCPYAISYKMQPRDQTSELRPTRSVHHQSTVCNQPKAATSYSWQCSLHSKPTRTQV